MTIDYAKVRLAVEAVGAYYKLPDDDGFGYSAGGSFHIWADDGNEGQIGWCTEYAREHGDLPGVILGCFLKTLTSEEEAAVLAVLVPCCWGEDGHCG